MTAEFMQLWLRGAQAHPAIRNGLATITVFDGRMDALTQANQFDTIITQRYDAIIFIPVDIQAGVGPAAQAKAAGIPLIGSNTLMADRSLYRCYIGSDGVVSGEDVARAVVTKLGGGKGNVVILEGIIGHSAQIERRQGIQTVLAQFPNVKVLEMKAANWSRADGQALMENWLTAHGSAINGVISQNDEMALGAIEALKARAVDLATHPVGGVDGLTDALDAVKRGEMWTTLQDANAQAQGSVDLALQSPDRAGVSTDVGHLEAISGKTGLGRWYPDGIHGAVDSRYQRECGPFAGSAAGGLKAGGFEGVDLISSLVSCQEVGHAEA